ncbi:mechanosensitive ion channel [Candidatus Peregrinibacteria bacterium]|nr:mechanosensitive ion channel [Candidatus Peregrinibacteria bacterium]
MTKLVEFLLGIHTVYAQVGTSATQVKDETQAQLAGILDFVIVKIPSFIAAFIVFVLFFLISKAIKGIVESRMSAAFEEHKEVQILAGRTAAAVTLIIGATVALNIAGIDLTVIIAAAGFGIGFALRDIITNFLAGVMILAQKHFTIGDMIKVDGTLGKIIDIQARATILKAIDGTKVIVPNSQLFTKQVKSFTSNPFRRIEVGVCASYGEDIELAIKTCYAVAQHTKGVLMEPKPVVLVTEWGDNNVDMVVRAWVDSKSAWLKIKSDLTLKLLQAFDNMNIRYDFHRVTLDYDKDIVAEHEATVVDAAKLPEWLAQVKESKTIPNQPSPSFKPYVSKGPAVDRPGATFLTVQQEIQQIRDQEHDETTPAPETKPEPQTQTPPSS